MNIGAQNSISSSRIRQAWSSSRHMLFIDRVYLFVHTPCHFYAPTEEEWQSLAQWSMLLALSTTLANFCLM
jgi:hypothetical protein